MKHTGKKNRTVYKLSLVTAIAAGYAGIGSACASVNTTATLTSGTALDVGADWTINGTTGTEPTSSNDALFAPGYPMSGSLTTTLSSNESFGSIDATNANTIVVHGNSNSALTTALTLGGGAGTNGITGASPNDLIYIGSAAYIDIPGGGTGSNGIVAVTLAASGNFDCAGEFFDGNRIMGTGTITKTGTGPLYLNSNNSSWVGNLNISAGSVYLNQNGALGNASNTVNFTGTSTLYIYNTTMNFAPARVFNISSGVTATINSNGYTGNCSNPIIGAGSFAKAGTGILTLNGSSAWQGNTTVTAGTLVVNSSAAWQGNTIVNGGTLTVNGSSAWQGSTTINGGTLAFNVSSGGIPNTPLTLGGGTLNLAAGFATNQIVPQTNLTGGTASTVVVGSFSDPSLSFSMGALNVSAGATIDFTLPATGSITTTTANANYAGGQNTILGGYATANGQTSWSTSAGTGTVAGAIASLSNYDQTFNVAGADVDIVPSTNLNPTITTINSLRFNDSSTAYTVTLPIGFAIATGGILSTPNVGSQFNTIQSGTLTSGNGINLVVIQAATGFLTINSTIVDAPSNSIGLTKLGTGVLILGGTNTFTGSTNIFAGTLELGNALALQYSTVTFNGGQLYFEPGITNFNLGGIAATTATAVSLLDTGSSPVNLIFGGNNQNTVYNCTFTGAGGSLTKIGTGTTYVDGTASNFTGGFNISGGLIEFLVGGAFGANNNAPGTNSVTIYNGGGVWYNGSGAPTTGNFGYGRGFVLGGGLDTFQIGNITNATNVSSSQLNIGQVGNASSGILAGLSGATSTLQKTGLGTLNLEYNSTYNGGTNVAGGTLISNADNSLGDYTIGSNPSYNGSGPLAIIPTQLSATVEFLDPAPAVSSLTNFLNGNASGGTATIVLGAANGGVATTLSIGADNTNTVFSGNISDVSANNSSAVGSIIKAGTAMLTLSGSDTYTGATNVSSGTLALGSAKALPSNTNLSIGSAATVTALSISGGPYALKLNTLSNQGLIDLTTNAMIIHSGTTIASAYNLVAGTYNGGAWSGTTGITSSVAAANSTHLTTIGAIINDSNANTGNSSGTALYTSLDGASTVDGDILFKYTYYGDANLSGAVDGSDYSLIDYGYLNHLTGWYNGDFNYDGAVDGSDYTLIDNAFNSQGTALASELASPDAIATAQMAGSASAVPEPATLGLLAFGAAGLLCRKRRTL
jgi:fibronectin-binding autotransporter adhesin